MLYVKKLDGRIQKYDESKLKRSLSNSGADEKIINRIMARVDKILYNGIETKKLFKFAFNEYKKYQPYASSRYGLKNSILRLGSGGFVFEKFVATILKKQGYSTKLNQIVKGRYIRHEIDVSARRGNERVMVECKHHVRPWAGSDIQTALYIYARFLDVSKLFTVPMLVTNTKFSGQVLKYSKGVGLRLMGWKMPQNNSLECNIEKFKLYPITMLSSINEERTNHLLNSGIILINDMLKFNADEISHLLKITKSNARKVLEESRVLCRC